MKLLLIGGRMRPAGALDRDHEPLYVEGRVAELDTATGRVRTVWSWRSEAFDGPGLGHCFKGGRWDGDHLLICSEREVIRVDPGRWEVSHRFSHPWFNDLHDAMPQGEELVVLSTGLDAVLRFGPDEALLDAQSVYGPLRALPDEDYRIRSTKPHRSHPNHLFEYRGQLWVTRLLQSDVLALGSDPQALSIGVGPLHDGLVRGDSVWCTVVDGRLVELDLKSRRVKQVIGIDGFDRQALGWCRGLHFEGSRVFVGFSRLRTTRTRAYLARMRGWVRGRQHATQQPTRILEIDPQGAVIGRWPVQGAGMDAIFAVLPAEPPTPEAA